MTTYLTDVTLRDAHQCLIATRMRTEDMLPICKKMDEVGFWAMEVWGGATFDACLRFLKEDPWSRLKQLRLALPNTPLSMLLRGQNLLGYRHYADDVVKEFIHLAVKNGVDVFRVFDALNDVRNVKVAIHTIKKLKRHAQGAICYTTSPVHTLESFIEMGKAYVDMGCDSIAIKDMAGLLTPVLTVELFSALSNATKLPIHLHTHSTSGLASICHYEVVLSGCTHLDTAISSFSGGASHPAAEPLVAALKGGQYDTGLDLSLLLEIGHYFREVRKKYHQFESEAREIDPSVQLYQVPGGMISNLYNQLKEQHALDKLSAVQAEIPAVRSDLGFPPLVTPTSQIVGTQAVLNVLTGGRYKTITNEVKLYCQGKYGKPPGKLNARLRKKAIGHTEVIDVRPADLLPCELKKLRQEIGDLAIEEEDVLTYAMFGEVGRQFLEHRNNNTLIPEPLVAPTTASHPAHISEFEMALHGESYHVKVAGQGLRGHGKQAYYLWVDGVPEEVILQQIIENHEQEASFSTAHSKPSPGDVTVAMPGVVIAIQVTKGEKVQVGQVLLVLEAMKMETEIEAPISGIVEEIFCQKGEKVTPEQILIKLTCSDQPDV